MKRHVALPERGVVFDALAAIGAFALSLVLTEGSSSLLQPVGGATTTVLTLGALSLLLRRRAPVAVAWAAAGMTAALLCLEYVCPGTVIRPDADVYRVPLWQPTAPFAAYAVMAYARQRLASWAPVVALLALVLLTLPALRHVHASATTPEAAEARSMGQSASAGLAFRSAVFIVGGTLLGMYVSARRRELRSLTERAERARAEERARLAAEMHDVVSHRVSLMVVQASALWVTASDEATRAAAERLRADGCQALEELRDVVGLLRRTVNTPEEDREGDEDSLSPAVPDLLPLVEESESVGVPVELIAEGDPALASPVVSRTVYRIVQEALTNVRKHAPGARVRVLVRCRNDGIRLVVSNTAPTRAVDARLSAAGSGTGLLGLTHRVELIRGTLEAGPQDDGGFCVRAVLPAYVATADSLEPLE
ncbi:sensor histidine kinase [Streptomyces cyanogenus]|uniref:histidine kinase n=1 Tax=Streptomyces cyanogenus TaxID=80860 RepID=A0ABX7TM60_STRCY|nr:sensor histidine kinase [Streptomyces cyanogenus]QTD96678.1 Sensor histidine kinase LiaS [Streptomyces cyanogenus]